MEDWLHPQEKNMEKYLTSHDRKQRFNTSTTEPGYNPKTVTFTSHPHNLLFLSSVLI
jgi:hypothetical protein